MTAEKAIVLLSGGLDSTTCCAYARERGFEITALTFAYGQRHRVEVARAREIAQSLEIQAHHVVPLDLGSVGGSVLTGPGEVPKDSEDPTAGGIPVTYVPARNMIFLAVAAAWAEVRQADAIFIGVNHLDWSGYPDCRPEFIAAMQEAIRCGTKAGVEGRAPQLQTPLIDMPKSQIIQLAASLGVDLARTVSCYEADDEGRACGRCDSCLLRRKGFAEAELPDPTVYQP